MNIPSCAVRGWQRDILSYHKLNKANLISSAYAAFKPNEALLKRFNNHLILAQNDGTITPGMCYILKTNPTALNLLSRKTFNDEKLFTPETPFEILRDIENAAYEHGFKNKQKDVDILQREKDISKCRFNIENTEEKAKTLQAKMDATIAKNETLHI